MQAHTRVAGDQPTAAAHVRPRFAVITIGCKVNQCDSDGLVRQAEAAGWQHVDNPAKAHVTIVNTCTVTQHAEATARKTIRQIRGSNPAGVIIVAGCAARVRAEMFARMAEVDEVTPAVGSEEIVALMKAAVGRKEAAVVVETPNEHPPAVLRRGRGRTRVFVKVQDGCNQFCGYCAVPYARGMPRSVPIAALLEEIERLQQAGVREVVVSGINLALYRTADGNGLPALLRAVAGTGVPRVRVSSLEASAVTPELLRVFADHPNLMPHLHMPLQSGSAHVLSHIRRPVSPAMVLRAAEAWYAAQARGTITTDVIVGLPGETAEDVDATIMALEHMQAAKAHVFVFSERPGTFAASLRAPATPAIELQRRKRLVLAEAERIAARCRERFVGTNAAVLIERAHGDVFEGLTDNYLRVRTSDVRAARGAIVTLTLDNNITRFVTPA